MLSFYKKDLGSAGHRRHQGPSVESTASSEDELWAISDGVSTKLLLFLIIHIHYYFNYASDYATWQSGRSQMNTSANVMLANKSPGLLPRPPVQTIHGRTDWSAKYGHH